MPNFKLTLAYDGTEFSGWQTQPDARTVQETMQAVFESIVGGSPILHASGRTDAGVHALAQVAHCHVATRLGPDAIRKALNARLPQDVSVKDAKLVPDEFHANKSAVKKCYRYVIRDGPTRDPFTRGHATFIKYHLDAERMARAASAVVGTHDFRCFETEWPNRRTSVRTVTRLDVGRLGEYVVIRAEADGFLYNMVRAIAGTLMQIGRGFWPEERMAEVIAAGDRRLAGPTAPPQGLFLARVYYPPEAERFPGDAELSADDRPHAG